MENQIHVLRKQLGISQEDLARRCGVSRQTINAIENNKYDPTLALAFHLAQVLGTTWMPCFVLRSKRNGCRMRRQKERREMELETALTEFFEMRPILAQARMGTYFIIPLRYEAGALRHDRIQALGRPWDVTTMDLSETVKRLFYADDTASIGGCYRIDAEALCQALFGGKQRLASRVFPFPTKMAARSGFPFPLPCLPLLFPYAGGVFVSGHRVWGYACAALDLQFGVCREPCRLSL